jgi:p-cumate 2,3-dioxygenase beta subunit
MTSTDLLREVEQFLFHEGELLDDLQFAAWFDLFAEGGRYVVPSTDRRELDPSLALMLINDDYGRLRGRVQRLQSRDAHADYPHPRTRRLITNVRAREVDDTVEVRANFLVYALRVGKVHEFIGEYRHSLERHDGALRFRSRTAVLDLETLGQAGGKINVIV